MKSDCLAAGGGGVSLSGAVEYESHMSSRNVGKQLPIAADRSAALRRGANVSTRNCEPSLRTFCSPRIVVCCDSGTKSTNRIDLKQL